MNELTDEEKLELQLAWPDWRDRSPLGPDLADFAKLNPPGPTESDAEALVPLLQKTRIGWAWPHSRMERGRHVLRHVLWRFIRDDEAGTPPEHLFNLMARDLLAHGIRPWGAEQFFAIYNHARKMHDDKIDAARKARDSIAGRKPSDKTGRVQLIMETIRVARSRAYDIEQNGIGNFEDRKALAAAFRDDPKRSYPGAWELAHGGRHGRQRGRPTLAAYINSGDADFDGYPALERLKAACRLGALPETFRDSDAFIAALETCAIDAGQALAIWRIGGPWRDPN